MLPPTSQAKPFGVTALLDPQSAKVQVIAARYNTNNGESRPQVTLGGDFDVDQIALIHLDLLEKAEIPQNSPYFPVMQALQRLRTQQQATEPGTQSRQHLQQNDWRQGGQQR